LVQVAGRKRLFGGVVNHKLEKLSGASQRAADESYVSTTMKLCDGLEKTVASYKEAEDARQKQVYDLWLGCCR